MNKKTYCPPIKDRINKGFIAFARAVDNFTSSPAATFLAFAIIVIWAFMGPIFHYSDGWQLVINTGTTIITFLMIFIIAVAQRRFFTALMTKIDALILAIDAADNKFIDLEDKEEDEIIRDREEILARVLSDYRHD